MARTKLDTCPTCRERSVATRVYRKDGQARRYCYCLNRCEYRQIVPFPEDYTGCVGCSKSILKNESVAMPEEDGSVSYWCGDCKVGLETVGGSVIPPC